MYQVFHFYIPQGDVPEIPNEIALLKRREYSL